MRMLLSIVPIACLLMGGCSREEQAGPVLRIGVDECVECGMVILEDRSAAIVVADRDGGRTQTAFDDPGCLLDFLRDRETESADAAVFVKDYATGGWLDGRSAWYLLADRKRMPTPMNSGLAAFATEDRVREAQREYGGEILRYEELAAARRNWLEERFGPRG